MFLKTHCFGPVASMLRIGLLPEIVWDLGVAPIKRLHLVLGYWLIKTCVREIRSLTSDLPFWNQQRPMSRISCGSLAQGWKASKGG